MAQEIADSHAGIAGRIDEVLATLGDDPIPVERYREALAKSSESLTASFNAGANVGDLVRRRAAIVDAMLTRLWRTMAADLESCAALVAVGGYGRGELHPFSDIDILVLIRDDLPALADAPLSAFMTALWDLGLEIGHSVRTCAQCREEAGRDITVATTLMEARLLAGPLDLFESMAESVSPDSVWPSDRFFAAKCKEQEARHHRYDDTAYKLEPNVKGSPGGLRDIQTIAWVAQRHFGGRTFDDLVKHGFLSDGQLKILRDGRAFLWRVRFALHVLTGRREDRLLFDHQSRIAEMLGYEDASYTLAVEQLMQRYYRTVMELSRLNEMLLQLFEEEILLDRNAEPRPINARFQVRNGYLQTTDDEVFERDPSSLLEIFLLLQQHDDIRGVSAHTVSLLRRNLHLIDEEFRQNPRNHRLFLQILRAPAGVTHELRRMNLYGVLGLYIPAFGRIVGRMQYDLFHAYTVDQHTLFVVSNLRRFALPRFDNEQPHCSSLMQSFDKPEIVYIAGLFHDIAKGRGGDHSELGAVDAEAFCLEHGLSQYDARTVAWLVRHHLQFSMTAQKKDISDPKVINEFAAFVRDKTHLDYLYVLTVADVNGTNPKLWNSWKAQLFRDLYELTAQALRHGLENPIDRELLIADNQDAARELLDESRVAPDDVERIWNLFNEDYFLRYRPGEIAWHTEVLADSDTESGYGLLDVRRRVQGDGIEALLYTPRIKRTFAHATALLIELGTTIADVRILPLENGFSIDTYVFMELDRRVEVDDARLNKIRRTLTRVIAAHPNHVPDVSRLAPRQVRLFRTPTVVSFDQDRTNGRTIMELVAADRPGLLSIVGRLFIEFGVDIETAKILTIGERAEDVFYITDLDGNALPDALCTELRTELVSRIDLMV